MRAVDHETHRRWVLKRQDQLRRISRDARVPEAIVVLISALHLNGVKKEQIQAKLQEMGVANALRNEYPSKERLPEHVTKQAQRILRDIAKLDRRKK